RIYYLWQGDGERIQFIEDRVHGMGVCPIVRYANQLDLEGRAPGEVEPLIPLAARINKTDYDRMLAQHYNSWKVRYATNLEEPPTSEEAERIKLKLRQSDILTGEGETQFGTLDETPLEGFIQAHDSDLEALGAASQTPVTAFGKLINVSAEGLLEARTSLYARRDERQMLFGDSHTATLRLAAHAEGRAEDADDFEMTLKWADTEARTLNQAVDALGKAANMLGVPQEMLWNKIPGVDLTEVESWREYREEHPTPDDITAQALERQTRPVTE
ncbi:MAG TPA: phage portal protein, partial [Nocardioidaceae bacterium]|nr:phage portal protein [Nocardioidaceae bacterium]